MRVHSRSVSRGAWALAAGLLLVAAAWSRAEDSLPGQSTPSPGAGAEPPAADVVDGPPPLFHWRWDGSRLTVVGETRIRVESSDNFDFDRDLHDDDTLILERIRLGFEYTLEDLASLRIEAQDAEEQESRAGPDVGEDGPDLRRCYLQAHPGIARATLGRQDFTFGAERIFGLYDFRNLDNHFDGARAGIDTGTVRAELYYARPVDQVDRHFNESSHHVDVYGAYASWQFTEAASVEFLYVRYRDDRRQFGGVAEADQDPDAPLPLPGDLAFDLFDLRLSGEVLGGLRFDFEAAYETGGFGPDPLRAHAYYADVGYEFKEVWAKPYVGVAHSHTSGDRNPDDRRSRTWVPIFPNIQNYSFYTLANLRETVFTFACEPLEDLALQLDYRLVRLDRARDAFYDENFAVYLADPTGAAGRDVGAELDLWVSCTLAERIQLEFGFSKFFAGDFAKDLIDHTEGPRFAFLSGRVQF